MTYKISKELFEAVMGEYDYFGTKYKKNLDCIIDNSILYYVPYSGNYEILINDFFFKCKEYAFKNGYLVTTSQCKDGTYICYLNLKITLDLSGLNKGGKVHSYSGLIRSDSELQAVFDACQWLLDKKRDKNELPYQ